MESNLFGNYKLFSQILQHGGDPSIPFIINHYGSTETKNCWEMLRGNNKINLLSLFIYYYNRQQKINKVNERQYSQMGPQ